MLVTFVSTRARRKAITVDLAEEATAVDDSATGNIVFATLVDDPANVGDHVDAYLGENMAEAASAASTVTAGLIYAVALLEEANAISALSGNIPTIYADSVTEAASASSTQDATIISQSDSAMLPKVYVNPSTPRQANVLGIMVNL